MEWSESNRVFLLWNPKLHLTTFSAVIRSTASRFRWRDRSSKRGSAANWCYCCDSIPQVSRYVASVLAFSGHFVWNISEVFSLDAAPHRRKLNVF